MIDAVVDTNVLVRAVIKPAGTFGPVLGRLQAASYRLIASQPLLDELVDVLSRRRIRSKYGLNAADVTAVLQLVLLRSTLVTPTRQITACRDPKDNMVLEAALAGMADVIVTGDEDLLVLHPFESIPIVTPSRFLAMLDAADRGS